MADSANQVIRRVNRDHTIETIAGTGDAGYSGDGGPAVDAQLSQPMGVANMPDGGFLIADAGNNVIRRVSPSGIIETLAGKGSAGFSGDRGPATSAELRFPRTVRATGAGTYLIADTGNERIRRISRIGIITTVAGTGQPGYDGDGGRARRARLNNPTDAASTGGGGFLIADRGNGVVRKVDPTGLITTVAGTGPQGPSAALGQATATPLDQPVAVTRTGDGGFLVAENSRIRRVAPDGTITTIAGTGLIGFSGERGLANMVALSYPAGLAPAGGGDFFVADAGNDRIRRISAEGTIATKAGSDLPVDPGGGRGIPGGDTVDLSQAVVSKRVAVPLPGGRLGSTRATADCHAYDSRYNFLGIQPYPASKPLIGRTRRRFTLVFGSTRSATVDLVVIRARPRPRAVDREHATVSASIAVRLRLGHRLAPGRYRVRLVGEASGAKRCVSRTLEIKR